MGTIGGALGFVVGGLSDKNYTRSLDFYRFWFSTGQTFLRIPSDPIFDAIWKHRVGCWCARPIHQTAHLILRFASDAESDQILAPYSTGLQSRLCAMSLQEFSHNNLMVARYGREAVGGFYTDVNLVAHWANLGYVEEATIHDHVLQSLISHPTLYDHQVDALIILFKLAGATFEAYADPSVVDHCFELLKGHSYTAPYGNYDGRHNDYYRIRKELVQVSAPRVVECGHRT